MPPESVLLPWIDTILVATVIVGSLLFTGFRAWRSLRPRANTASVAVEGDAQVSCPSCSVPAATPGRLRSNPLMKPSGQSEATGPEGANDAVAREAL